MELLRTLMEMGAQKLCDKCGKSMAANHYWYKGGWKCKTKPAEQPAAGGQPATPEQPVTGDPAKAPEVQNKTTLGSTPVPPREEPAAVATPVVTQPLEITVDIIAEARPYLEAELTKINKTAAKVGAKAIDVQLLKTYYKDVTKRIKDISHIDGSRVVTVKQKFLTIKMTGTTPRITAADGTVWNFVGVITPSKQGKAILKLTPTAGDAPGIRRLHSANPYYCDYCKKVRQRNETFIINNGDTYRQVGRNCLKDFVGGADPQALLNFFSWFSSPEAMEASLFASVGGGGEDDDGYGGAGGRRGAEYLSPLDILTTTVAVLEVRGGYVSAKVENGRSTASDVRFVYWGRITRDTPQSEVVAQQQIRNLRDQPKTKEEAQKIIDWFKALPPSTIESNTFFQNVKVMIDEDAVESKQIGYIVGLYPAYQRAQQQSAERSPTGARLVKEWPAEWGEGPQPINNEHATVKFVRNLVGTYGTSQLVFMMLDNGYGVTWKYSGKNDIKEGDEFNITGELQKDTYREPATIKFVPSRKWLRSEAFV